MLQGRLVSTDILFQLKNPILVNVHEQDITRKKNTYRSGFFFSVQNYLSTTDAKNFVFQEANSKIIFL